MEYDQVNAAFKVSVKEYSDKLSMVKAKVEVPPEKIHKEVGRVYNRCFTSTHSCLCSLPHHS